jgi:hypothetical protein
MMEKTSTTTTHAMMKFVQEKTWLYVEQAPSDDFIPFTIAIETYGCLHSRFYLFFTTCAWTIIACHQRYFLIPSMLVSYY